MAASPSRGGPLQMLQRWGEHSVPPALLATLITAQHMRPFQGLPMMFPPVLLFSSYVNLAGLQTDAAGITAAWSGLYALLALRRKQGLSKKFTMRGLVRATSLGLCAVNVVGCGVAYAFGRRNKDAESPKE